MNIHITLTALVLGMSVSQAHAQIFDDMLTTVSDSISDITDAVLPGVTNIRVGLGPSISPDYEGSDDYNVGIKPLISFNYRDLIQVDNNNIRVNILGSDSLFPSKNFKAGPLLKVDFGRNENDSPDLTGMGDVDTSIELGIFASYNMDPVRIRIRAQQDVASGHSGTRIIGDLRTLLHQSDNLTITGSISSTWADQDYMNSYFGINPVQSRLSGMPVFDAGSGIKDVSLSLGGNYTFSDDWALVANLGYTNLLADAKDSPIVDLRGSSSQFSTGLFAVYSF